MKPSLASRPAAAFAALALCLFAVSAAHADPADHPAGKPLVVGSDFGVAPWMTRAENGPQGFGVDLVNEIAKRLGRPGAQVVDVNFSGLFSALFSKRIEFTANPMNITAERAQRMLFTEPIMSTGNGFLLRAGDRMSGFADLKGKELAVNRGTISDTWATENAAKYGFNIQRYDVFPDTVQAVITGRAFVALNEIPTVIFAASKNHAVKVGYEDFNGRNFGYAFRPDDADYRNRVDAAIECIKQDGTLHRLYVKWYGSEPAKGSAVDTVYPGYGAPGFNGYDPYPHTPSCK
ncbi:substrate-binding periplasmic protein [Burkholderia gladioli]|uniref:substrate-binding periplasmic protein n=1 Tax=Burkholderia gladioli TaxID=28095 RepID=UPI001640F818|nr:ABC transporter substrate-binding protein [Burkholderia gladioli]